MWCVGPSFRRRTRRAAATGEDVPMRGIPAAAPTNNVQRRCSAARTGISTEPRSVCLLSSSPTSRASSTRSTRTCAGGTLAHGSTNDANKAILTVDKNMGRDPRRAKATRRRESFYQGSDKIKCKAGENSDETLFGWTKDGRRTRAWRLSTRPR